MPNKHNFDIIVVKEALLESKFEEGIEFHS